VLPLLGYKPGPSRLYPRHYTDYILKYFTYSRKCKLVARVFVRLLEDHCRMHSTHVKVSIN
jgi:CRISPR/Cas system-associated protein Csm6